MSEQRKPRIIPKGEMEKRKKPEHPLYSAFTHQIGAALIVARQIDADKKAFTLPVFVQRFLDEFGRETA